MRIRPVTGVVVRPKIAVRALFRAYRSMPLGAVARVPVDVQAWAAVLPARELPQFCQGMTSRRVCFVLAVDRRGAKIAR